MLDAQTGAVKLIDNPDFETQASYSFTLIATDAAGNASERTVTLSITDIVDEVAPVFTSADTVDFIENSGATIYAAQVTDQSSITYSLAQSGDYAELSIDQTTGVVSLLDLSDFESKTQYTFTVVADDGTNPGVSQTVTANLLDASEALGVISAVDDPRVLISPVNESTLSVEFTVTRSSDTGAASVDWSTTGSVASDFGASLPSGTVSFADGEQSASVTINVPSTESLIALRTAGISLQNPSTGFVVDPDYAQTQVQLINTTVVDSITAFTVSQDSDGVIQEGLSLIHI